MSGNVAENWKKFIQRFSLYKVASGYDLKEDKVQVALLLHVMGEEALDIFNTFTWAQAADADTYAKVVEKFEDYFIPQKNVVLERFHFNKAAQDDGEDFDHFVTKLRNLASTCEFETLKDSLIRDKIVVGINSNETRERLLRAGGDLTLGKAISMCQTAELTKVQMQALKADQTTEIGDVRKEKSSRVQFQQQKKPVRNRCGRCGSKHVAGQCPAYGKTCSRCRGRNHFAKCCKTKNIDTLGIPENSDTEQENDDLWFDTITVDEVQYEKTTRDWICPIRVNETIIPLKLDTGAQANVLSSVDFKYLKGVKLHKAEQTLRGYTGHPLKIKGKCMLSLTHNNTKTKRLFFVSDGTSHSILGKDLCVKLGLIKLNCRINTVSKDLNESQNSHRDYSELIKDHEDIFQGLGELPGEYHIEVDKEVTPVVNPCRKIPFPLQEKLKEELTRMENLGVIVKVEEPTDWVSSIVLVEKPNGKLRVCLDPRSLNKAVKRQHFKLPTREEVMAKFANARIFTKLDASQGFWQLNLDTPSSFLTTFNTPFGRYRYTRLPYGIKCAPEVFHKRIWEIFEDINNVDTSMDDIIIYGPDQASHDKTLKKVLDKIKENNLKLNKDKCQFGVNSLVFLGDKLTDEGVKPDPRKVSAIENMPKPKDKAGIQRFLGMVTYMAKWVPDLTNKTAPF